MVHTVELRRGRCNFAVGTGDFDAGTASVAVWPALAPGGE